MYISEITCDKPDSLIDLMCVELVARVFLCMAVRPVSFIIATL